MTADPPTPRDIDGLRSDYLRECMCPNSGSQHVSAKPPKTWVITASSGLPERWATCTKCGAEACYTGLFGFVGHLKPGKPHFEQWLEQHVAAARATPREQP